MTTDFVPKTRRLICRSACPRELSDFAEWLSAEGYTAAPIHLHLTYLDQALARVARPHDPSPRDLAAIERAFDPVGGPLTRRRLFEGTRRAYVRFLRARGRLIEPQPRDRFASLRCEYLTEVRGLSASSRWHHADTVADFLVRGISSRKLRKYVDAASRSVTTLRNKRIHPHSIRHSTGHRVPQGPASTSPRSASGWVMQASTRPCATPVRTSISSVRRSPRSCRTALALPRGRAPAPRCARSRGLAAPDVVRRCDAQVSRSLASLGECPGDSLLARTVYLLEKSYGSACAHSCCLNCIDDTCLTDQSRRFFAFQGSSSRCWRDSLEDSF